MLEVPLCKMIKSKVRLDAHEANNQQGKSSQTYQNNTAPYGHILIVILIYLHTISSIFKNK